jgi:hypothetical protein
MSSSYYIPIVGSFLFIGCEVFATLVFGAEFNFAASAYALAVMVLCDMLRGKQGGAK